MYYSGILGFPASELLRCELTFVPLISSFIILETVVLTRRYIEPYFLRTKAARDPNKTATLSPGSMVTNAVPRHPCEVLRNAARRQPSQIFGINYPDSEKPISRVEISEWLPFCLRKIRDFESRALTGVFRLKLGRRQCGQPGGRRAVVIESIILLIIVMTSVVSSLAGPIQIVTQEA